MPTRVNIPGLGVVNFPDEMTEDQINTEAQKLYEQQSQPSVSGSQPITGQPTGTLRDVPEIVAAVESIKNPPPGPGINKKTILPTGLSIAGSLGGGAIAGPLGATAGEMAGSGIGEYINQKLGITEPSGAQIGMAVAAPAAGRVMSGLAKQGLGIAAKMFGGRQVMSEAAEEAAKKMLMPKMGSDELFSLARQSNVTVPTGNTALAVDDIMRLEKGRADTAIKQQIAEAVEPLQGFFGAPGSGTRALNVDDLLEESQRLRYMASKAYDSNPPNSKLGNALSKIRNAMLDDFKDAGVETIAKASTAYRKEMAIEELGKVIRRPNALNAFKDLRTNDELFKGAFTDAEVKQIEPLLKKLGTVAPSGFSGVVGRALSVGGGATVGGAVGAIAGLALPEATAYALASKPGRVFLEKLLIGGSGFDAPKAAALMTWTRAKMAEDRKAQDIAEDVKAVLKNKVVPIQEKIQAAQLLNE